MGNQAHLPRRGTKQQAPLPSYRRQEVQQRSVRRYCGLARLGSISRIDDSGVSSAYRVPSRVKGRTCSISGLLFEGRDVHRKQSGAGNALSHMPFHQVLCDFQASLICLSCKSSAKDLSDTRRRLTVEQHIGRPACVDLLSRSTDSNCRRRRGGGSRCHDGGLLINDLGAFCSISEGLDRWFYWSPDGSDCT